MRIMTATIAKLNAAVAHIQWLDFDFSLPDDSTNESSNICNPNLREVKLTYRHRGVPACSQLINKQCENAICKRTGLALREVDINPANERLAICRRLKHLQGFRTAQGAVQI